MPKITKNLCEKKKQHFTKKCKNKKTCGKTKEEPLQKNLQNKQNPIAKQEKTLQERKQDPLKKKTCEKHKQKFLQKNFKTTCKKKNNFSKKKKHLFYHRPNISSFIIDFFQQQKNLY